MPHNLKRSRPAGLHACSLARLCLVWVGILAVAQAISAQVAPLPDPSVPSLSSDPFDPDANPTKPDTRQRPMARLEGWSRTSELDSSAQFRGDDIQLEAEQQEIVLFFNAVPKSPGPVEFRYRLTGFADDWTVTRSHLAHYRRLPPGAYRFQVQARLPDEQWPAQSSELGLERRPFFYQTWYFYLLVLVGIVGLAAQLLGQRDQLLKGQMGMVLEERNRIASDCHDTLMAGFAAISWQLEATAKLFRDSDDDETPAARSCELARSMVAHCQAEARRIIWDLRDSDELTDILSLALSRAIAARRLNDSIQASFNVQGDEIPIAPGAVHHLVCIGQEAVTNALRHAQASAIEVLLRYESDLLSLIIRDNGRGFNPNGAAIRFGHFGIPVMEERSRKLGGTLRVTSSDTGTEVAVTVSFTSINEIKNQQHHVVPWIGV